MPRARCCAWRKVLHEHVRIFEQLRQDALCLRALHIQCEALLGAIAPHEVRSETADPAIVRACEVATARPLDLDDTRTQVSKLTRTEWGGDRVF